MKANTNLTNTQLQQVSIYLSGLRSRAYAGEK